MVRPRCNPTIEFKAKCNRLRPDIKPDDCAIILTLEEAESLRLKNIEKLHQTEAAKRMHVSQSTFQRMLQSAYVKMSRALIEGREIQIRDT